MTNNKLCFKASDLIWCGIFTIFMFQNMLNIKIEYFRYVDEIVTIFLGLYTIAYVLKKGLIDKVYLKIYFFIIILCGIGITGNITSDVTRTPTMIALDIMYLFKVFICFIGASVYFENPKRNGKLLNLLASEVRLIVSIAFICLIISQFADIGMTKGIRYGIKCFMFVYSSAGMLSQYCIIFLIILTAELAIHKLNAKRCITFAMLIAVWAATARSRAFVMIIVWLFICYISRHITVFHMVRNNDILQKLFRPQHILVVTSAIVLSGLSQFIKYFGNGVVSSRNLLVSGGIRIMRDFFPFGAGFGTFGTQTAATYYSPLYYQYDLNSFWGLAEDGSQLTDCYWPAICGELGIIGLVFMVILVYLFVRQYYEQSKGNKFFIIASLTYIIYLLISSIATGIFASYVTAEFIIICVAIVSTVKNEKRGIAK